MTTAFTIRRALTVGALTLAWCGLWRSVSLANVLSGLAVTIVILALGIGTPATAGVKPIPLAKLGWLVLIDLVTSTIDVAVEIITPTDRTQEGVVAVTVPEQGRQHLLLLTIAITLTPGTAVVDADPDTGTLYLHLLHIDRRDQTVAHAEELAELACEAFPLMKESTA